MKIAMIFSWSCLNFHICANKITTVECSCQVTVQLKKSALIWFNPVINCSFHTTDFVALCDCFHSSVAVDKCELWCDHTHQQRWRSVTCQRQPPLSSHSLTSSCHWWTSPLKKQLLSLGSGKTSLTGKRSFMSEPAEGTVLLFITRMHLEGWR